jgi:hypothetical protein
VSNELNKSILARLIGLKIVDPSPIPELRVRGVGDVLKPPDKPACDGHAKPQA